MACRSLLRRGLWLAGIGILLAVSAEYACGNAVLRFTPDSSGPLFNPRAAQDPTKIARPAPFVVRRDNEAMLSRIIIPRQFLPVGNNPWNTNDARPTSMRQQNATRGGLLLATVITGGGLLVAFVRRRKTRAAAASLVGMFAASIVVSTAMAGLILPSPVQPDLSAGQLVKVGADNLTVTSPLLPQATVEIVETGDAITIVLGKNSPLLVP